MTTFALVHGAWHNGACWGPTAAVLRQRGHDVVTMDLPCTDPAAGLEECATVVHDAIGGATAPSRSPTRAVPPSGVVQLRPQVWTPAIQPNPLSAYPDVPTHAIVCAEDRVLQADTRARFAEERFDARVTRLGGGHTPMIAQFEALADAPTSGLT